MRIRSDFADVRTMRPLVAWFAFVLLWAHITMMHEAGNMLLPAQGVTMLHMNERAVSCLCTTAGLVGGLACAAFLTRSRGPRQANAARRLPTSLADFASLPKVTWVSCALLTCMSAVALYATARLAPPHAAACAMEVAGNASGAFMLAFLMRALFTVDETKARIGICAAVAAMPMLAYAAPLAAADLPRMWAILPVAHIAVAVGGSTLACVSLAAEPFALASAGESDDRRNANDDRKRPSPRMLIAFAIAGYGFAFGVIHVLPFASARNLDTRFAAFVIGAIAAAVVLYAWLGQRGRIQGVQIWAHMHKAAFPATMVAMLVLPLTVGSNFAPSALNQFAVAYFDAMIVFACFEICTVRRCTDIAHIAALALGLRYAGFFLGSFIASILRMAAPLDTATFSVAATAVFIVLAGATFFTGAELNAKTYWGMVPKEDAHGLYERRLERRCADLAKRHDLTERERTVMVLMAHNKRAQTIGTELTVSVNTVRSHMQSIYAKLDIHSQAELIDLVKAEESRAR